LNRLRSSKDQVVAAMALEGHALRHDPQSMQ
jgi:hypothetical protein